MTPNDSYDTSCDLLARLSRQAPDSERAERTRLRCRARLERRRQRSEHITELIGDARRDLPPLAVGGFLIFCVVYLGALVANILGLRI